MTSPIAAGADIRLTFTRSDLGALKDTSEQRTLATAVGLMHTLFFGLQMFLKEYLTEPVTRAHIDEAEPLLAAHGVPFHRAGCLSSAGTNCPQTCESLV